MESIASKIKNEVTKVKTKPTPLAAWRRAMVLRLEDTVYIFIVENKAYIPMAKKITIGILVNMFTGNKNQNIPTLKVNSIGKIKETKVIFLPKPSKNDQKEKTQATSTKIAIAGNLNCPGKNWIKTKPADNRMEEIANLNFFDIDSINYIF